MREILFRGKRVDNGEWVYWTTYGKFTTTQSGKLISGNEGLTDWAFELLTDPNTVGQYTGLKDKNGKRIFGGDIVKAQDDVLGSPFCYGIIGKIVYAEAAYFIEPKDPMGSQWLFGECTVYEIIGNIHDNPELLED